MGVVKETRKRSILKSILWRVIATINSYFVLSLAISDGNLMNAIIMNITGLIIMFYYERIWSKINYGRYIEEV
jgi:hypothetical protein